MIVLHMKLIKTDEQKKVDKLVILYELEINIVIKPILQLYTTRLHDQFTFNYPFTYNTPILSTAGYLFF